MSSLSRTVRSILPDSYRASRADHMAEGEGPVMVMGDLPSSLPQFDDDEGPWINDPGYNQPPNYLSEIKVSMTNLSPERGQAIAPLWFGLHDGSYDYFDEGQPASIAVKVMAEDGETGDPQGRFAPEVFEAIFEAGVDPSKFPAPEDTLSGQFAASPAGQAGGYQDVLTNNRLEPLLVHQMPGETVTLNIELDSLDPTTHRYFSYASMPFPTNDGFIGNDDPTEVALFDEMDRFIGANFVVAGSDVWDAGTEVNDESPISLPFELSQLFEGTPENGVIHKHTGLLPAGSGGGLDLELNGEKIFENADFTAEGYQMAQIEVAGVFEGGHRFDTITGTLGGDDIYGKGGHDTLYGDPDRVKALSVDQEIPLGGDDLIDGGRGNDFIHGQAGDDQLYGQQGRDRIYGGDGDDLLDGGIGSDVYHGGAGADTFVLAPGFGFDVVRDFQVGTDYLQLDDQINLGSLEISQYGHRTFVGTEDDSIIAILNDVNANELNADSFVVA